MIMIKTKKIRSICRFSAVSAAFFVSALLSGPALAAAPPFAPTPADPGGVMRDLETERRTPRVSDEAVTVPRYEDPDTDLSTEKVFVLNGVVLDEGTVYSDDALLRFYSDFLGEQVSFADLNRIARRITRKYREDGYVFSRAILPPQRIEDGIVRLQAIEGRITNIEILGEYKDNAGLIRSFAEKIPTSGPANTREIERYLLLIDDLPGIRARSIMRPSEERAGGELIITVEQKTFEGSVGIDNRGSRYLGPYRATVVGAFNALFSRHDRTTLRAIVTSQTRELRFADISHEQQVGTEGTRLKGRAAVTRTKPGGNIGNLNIDGDSELFDAELLHPLLRNRRYNLNYFAGATVLNSETDILSGTVRTNDRIRTLRTGAAFDFIDPWGINRFDATLTKGIKAFGATSDGTGRSRVNASHSFVRANFNASRIQNIYGNVSLLVSATGQATDQPLLASEEFSVGGPAFGRAYDSGEISGDQGYAGMAELRYNGFVGNNLIRDYQLYGYIDYGKIRNINPTVGENANASVTSSGLGVRFNLEHDFSGSLELTNPMTRQVASEGDKDARVFFNILKRF